MWKNLKPPEYYKDELLALSGKETAILLGKSIFVTCMLDYFFYRSVWMLLPLSLLGFGYYRLNQKEEYRKKRELVREQFKELMLFAATGQRAGYSVENALLSGYQDMERLYGKNSSICRILVLFQAGRANQVQLSDLWKQIGWRLAITEIDDFAQIYEIALKSSGDMAAVMEKTADIIVTKTETEKEIAVMLSARRLEQKIMNAMPFLIMLYIDCTSPGYFNGLYHNLPGIMIMSFSLAVYIFAYLLSVHMISIEV